MTIEETLLHDLNAKYQEYVQASRKYIEHKSIDECVAMNSGLVDRNRRITKAITSLREELKEYQETVENRDKTIALRGDVIKRQLRTIEGLKHELCVYTRSINSKNVLIDNLENSIEGLEAELSARKHDSDVLMKVVEIAKTWDRPIFDLRMIHDIVEDYIDTSEPSIEEDNPLIVKVAFLELP